MKLAKASFLSPELLVLPRPHKKICKSDLESSKAKIVVGSHKIRYVRSGQEFWCFDIISLTRRTGSAGPGASPVGRAWRNPAVAGLRRWWRRPYNWFLSRTRAVSSVGQSASFTPRRSEVQVLHRPPCRKGRSRAGIGPALPGPRWRNGRRAAFRAQYPYGCVGSNPSLGTNQFSGRVPAIVRL